MPARCSSGYGSPRVAALLPDPLYTRSIMNVSRARFTHSRQNGTLAESRSEEGSLTGSSAQPDTWRIPHSSPPFGVPAWHTYRSCDNSAWRGSAAGRIQADLLCVSAGYGWAGVGGDLSKDSLPIGPELRLKNERVAHHRTTPLATDVNVC